MKIILTNGNLFLIVIELIYWRDVRVVDGGSLENCCGETHRGFESLSPIAQLDRASVCGTEGRRFESSWSRNIGKMSEWSKETDSKSVVAIFGYRGFESLSFRKEKHPVLGALFFYPCSEIMD